MDIHSHIMKLRPALKSNSAKTYANGINTLHRKINPDTELTDLSFLSKNVEKVLSVIETYKPTTRKNMLNAVIVSMDEGVPQAVVKRYEKLRDKYNKQYEDEQEENNKNRKQSQNWVEWPKFQKMVEYFGKEVRRLKLRRRDSLSDEELRLLGDYVLMRVYEDLPMRNDVHDMRVTTEADYKKNGDKKFNYLLRSRNNYTIVLNNYKTAKAYGEKRIQVEGRLATLLRDYLKLQTSGWLFVNEKTGKPQDSLSITKRIQRITKDRLGKNAGSNMLRHSYLSHKYGENMKDMKKDSHIMGHSLKTQKSYIKISDDSP